MKADIKPMSLHISKRWHKKLKEIANKQETSLRRVVLAAIEEKYFSQKEEK